MTKYFLPAFAISVAPLFASVDCATTFYKAPTSGQGGGAVLGGWAKAAGKIPLAVTVKNGGASYTTLTDRDGKWSIFFRVLSSQAHVEAWTPDTGEFSTCKGFVEGLALTQ